MSAISALRFGQQDCGGACVCTHATCFADRECTQSSVGRLYSEILAFRGPEVDLACFVLRVPPPGFWELFHYPAVCG